MTIESVSTKAVFLIVKFKLILEIKDFCYLKVKLILFPSQMK